MIVVEQSVDVLLNNRTFVETIVRLTTGYGWGGAGVNAKFET